MPILDFEGKEIIHSYHYSVPHRPLCPDESRSLSPAGFDDNLIIHGDNLHALKALLPRYAGRVKCIYIDPPYNTGNEGWAYNDKVNSPLMKGWLNKAVGSDDLDRHDKWLCMMWPRLQLLKELLAEDGVICISCDDTELASLISILNEVFGEVNKEEIVCWRRRHNQPNDKSKAIAKTAEFIAVYSKSLDDLKRLKSFYGLPLTGNFKNPDNDPRGPWASKPWKSGSRQTGTKYSITTPTGVVHNEEWLGTQDTFESLLEDGRISFPKQASGLPRKKYYESERFEEGQVAHNFWGHAEFGSNQEASKEIREIGITFDNPKPTRLIKSIVQIFSSGEDIVLDSFAGSGTTAHAVLALNKEDGGNRKFILVECEDYADSITAERVRRVINGVPEARDAALRDGLGGSFTYCTLGEPIDVESMLSEAALPEFGALAAYLLYTASGVSADESSLQRQNANGLFYSTEQTDYYLIYEPSGDWLRGNDAVLNRERAEQISEASKGQGKEAIVYAACKYISQRALSELGIRFIQLPYEIHQPV